MGRKPGIFIAQLLLSFLLLLAFLLLWVFTILLSSLLLFAAGATVVACDELRASILCCWRSCWCYYCCWLGLLFLASLLLQVPLLLLTSVMFLIVTDALIYCFSCEFLLLLLVTLLNVALLYCRWLSFCLVLLALLLMASMMFLLSLIAGVISDFNIAPTVAKAVLIINNWRQFKVLISKSTYETEQ